MTDQIMAGPAPTLTQFHVRLWPLVSLGGVCGLAWAAALRGFMAQVAGAESGVSWGGTFGWILLPGVVTGLLLGWAEYLRRPGGRGGGAGGALAVAGLFPAAICERAASGAPRSGHDVPGWHRWGSDRSAAVRHGRRIC